MAGAAIAALGAIGTPHASDALEAAKVPNQLARALDNARIVAATHLVEAGQGPKAATLFRNLMSNGPTPAIRTAALKGLLTALPREEAVKLIVDSVQGTDAALRARPPSPPMPTQTTKR